MTAFTASAWESETTILKELGAHGAHSQKEPGGEIAAGPN